MTRFLKLVALALMLIMGVVPMLGAPLAPHCMDMDKGGPVMNAMSHCAMMAMMAAATDSSMAISGTHEMPPCCRVAPAKPVRAVELQIPPTASAELALEPANEAVNVAPIATQARTIYSPPLPDSARSQSHLCTFLI